MTENLSQEPWPLGVTPKWLALAKTPGWLTIPPTHSKDRQQVLIEWARARHGALWVVHRIDRPTSGVVLFARSEAAHREACQWFEKGKVKKTYVFISQGVPERPIWMIKHPIKGKTCTTQVRVIRQGNNVFLGEASPLTGRRHKIRIHLKEEGHPILGDTEYGGATEFVGQAAAVSVGRVALHAKRLELPDGNQFECEEWEDFAEWSKQI